MDTERLPPPPLRLFAPTAVPLYVASLLVLLAITSLAIATPLALPVRPALLVGALIALGGFLMPFVQSSCSAHAEAASLWVHQANWERRQHADPRRWQPSDFEHRLRRRLLFISGTWLAVMVLLTAGVWLGDRFGVARASLLSVVCLGAGALPLLLVYLGFERRWTRKADLAWQVRRIEDDLEAWEQRLAAPLGPLGPLPVRVPDNALIACFGVFLWLSFFAFLGAETGNDAMQLLAFPAWAAAGVAFLFGRDPSNARAF